MSILLHDHEGSLYLVEPKYAPANREWLIPAQEKVKRRIDHTLGSALRRCLREELRQSRQATFHPTELHRYKNHTPARRGKPAMTKYILVFAAYVETGTAFRPNPSEVREVVQVGPGELLDCLPPRQEKFFGTIDACAAAARCGLLPRQHWDNVLSI